MPLVAEAVGKIVADYKWNCERQKLTKYLITLFEGRALLSFLWKDLLTWEQENFSLCWMQQGTEMLSAVVCACNLAQRSVSEQGKLLTAIMVGCMTLLDVNSKTGLLLGLLRNNCIHGRKSYGLDTGHSLFCEMAPSSAGWCGGDLTITNLLCISHPLCK